MTTETPLRAWEPVLSAASLPNGMPLPFADETRIAGSSVATLDSGLDPDMWCSEFVSVRVDRHRWARPTQVRIVPDLGYAATLPIRDIFLEDATGWVTVNLPTAVTDKPIREMIEGLRDELGLEAAEMGRLLGVSRRSFYDLLKRQNLPSRRAMEVHDRTRLLASLAAEDRLTASSLVRERLDEVSDLLELGRFAGIRQMFAQARADRLAAHVAQFPAGTLAEVSRAAMETIQSLVTQPSFREVLAALWHISPVVDGTTSSRLKAFADLARNVDAAHTGGDVEQEWEFLVTLRHEEIDSVRDRALGVIREDAFAWERWKAFVAAEAEKAWASSGFVPLPPDEPDEYQPSSESGWEPNLARYGASLRYSDYLDRS